MSSRSFQTVQNQMNANFHHSSFNHFDLAIDNEDSQIYQCENSNFSLELFNTDPNRSVNDSFHVKVASAYFNPNISSDNVGNQYPIQVQPTKEVDFEEDESSLEVEIINKHVSNLNQSSKKIAKLPSISFSGMKPRNKKNLWQPAEDTRVLELVSLYGQSWANIAAVLGNRTGKQVRDRYLNYLRPDIRDDEFTDEEDDLLLKLYYEFGHKWSKIAQNIPGRSECQVKNRFYAHIKKRMTLPNLVDNNPMCKNIQTKAPKISNPIKKLNDKLDYDHQAKAEFNLKDEIYSNSTAVPRNEVNTESHLGSPHSTENGNVNENLHALMYNDPTDVISYGDQNKNVLEQTSKSCFNVQPCIQTHLPLENNIYQHTELNYQFNALEQNARYRELMNRKSALELFYSKTLQEINKLEGMNLNFS